MKNTIPLIAGIVVGLIVGGTLIFTGEVKDANYMIQHETGTYYVDSYTKENQGQCVYLSEKETRLCGEFAIKKLNDE